MGIYEREYYRDESRGSGWFSGVAPACKTLIVVNVVLFFVFWSSKESSFRTFWLEANSDAIFKHGRVWQLLTAAFLHDTISPLHVAWNMVFLWMFGREVENIYGSREFTFFYIAAAIFAGFCWAVVDLITPGAGHHQGFGASGAVMAVVTVYVLYYPHREMLLFFVLPVEAWMFLAIYLGLDAVMLAQDLQGIAVGSAFAVGFAAHLGGAIYGYLFKRFDLRLGPLISRRHRRPRLRVVSPPPRERDRDRERSSPLPATSSRSASVGSAAKGPPLAAFPEEQLDARLDEVLAKIAREGGKSGLTEEEHHILQEASRRARDRRSDRP
jgi:membrane associated rhomboid family serine protease